MKREIWLIGKSTVLIAVTLTIIKIIIKGGMVVMKYLLVSHATEKVVAILLKVLSKCQMNKKITPKPTSNFVNETLLKLAVKNKAIADVLIDYSPRNKLVIERARKKQKK
tara:strand:- start:64 stop:393 length:330 start_codon:yes stop_codon:yes gene_type:complete